MLLSLGEDELRVHSINPKPVPWLDTTRLHSISMIHLPSSFFLPLQLFLLLLLPSTTTPISSALSSSFCYYTYFFCFCFCFFLLQLCHHHHLLLPSSFFFLLPSSFFFSQLKIGHVADSTHSAPRGSLSLAGRAGHAAARPKGQRMENCHVARKKVRERERERS